ncbi:MAG: radical SAM protein [Clostridia bacterium]|nr:radical SAM protein [Clostridia bacterium]
MYEHCMLCPRRCGVDRNRSLGFCRMGARLFVSRAAPHFWEEPCISGDRGSGTVFFSGCSLRCVYCQNSGISRGVSGKEISAERLSEIFLELEGKGCHNINLVTPDHFAEHIIKAVCMARDRGLKIPTVYNTSGYCSVETLRKFRGLIDIYLTDFKYITPAVSEKYSGCADYAEAAKPALAEMISQCKNPVFEGKLMRSGVIVRHLCLPKNVRESKLVLDYLSEFKENIFVSIMSQYTPVKKFAEFPELSRKLKNTEYERVLSHAVRLGFENVFIQEGGAAEESFIPPFDMTGV